MTIIESAPIQTDPETEEEEPKFAHIVMREDQMKGYLAQEPIQALCGKVWIPSRDPEKLPVCEECVKIRDQIIASQKGMN